MAFPDPSHDTPTPAFRLSDPAPAAAPAAPIAAPTTSPWPPGLYVSTRKGMSGGAHAAHLVAALCTGGLWLVPYIAIAVYMSSQKTATVTAPAGTPQHIIDAAKASAERLTANEAREQRAGMWAIGLIFGLPVAICLVAMIGGQLSK